MTPDDQVNIPQPDERHINVAADAFDKQVTEPFEQFLDLSRHFELGGCVLWVFLNPPLIFFDGLDIFLLD